MQVKIKIKEILHDIRTKSHLEVQSIENVDARFNAEVSEEKYDEVYRELTSVNASLSRICHRYVTDTYICEGNDDLRFPDSFVYEFKFTPRRASGKVDPLTSRMHDYLVHGTLAAYYASVSQDALSQRHEKLATSAAEEVDALLLTKKQPIL